MWENIEVWKRSIIVEMNPSQTNKVVSNNCLYYNLTVNDKWRNYNLLL